MTNYWIDRLFEEQSLPEEGYKILLSSGDNATQNYLHSKAREVSQRTFSNKVYLRGLIEVSSYCHNNCYYCGLRASNTKAERYRLSEEQILECCEQGYNLGLRTFVMQGGEDLKMDDATVESIVSKISTKYPSCAITLSLGEKKREAYERLFVAGATRYLLRHETFNENHYHQLHPESMSHQNRLEALKNLKGIGFQTGSGVMVGSPFQTIDNLVEDIIFLERFKPQMIGIGPFIAHHQTPFASYPNGDVSLTLRLLSILRLISPKALIPSTTALATLSSEGHKLGILAGANVIMPNLSPSNLRSKYAIYDNKASWGSEAAEGINILQEQLHQIGYKISFDRGDSPMLKNGKYV